MIKHLFLWFFVISVQADWIKPSHRKYFPKLFEKSEEDSVRVLYGENYAQPASSYEALLMDHMQESLKQSMLSKSKLNGRSFNFYPVPLHHLLNNLCALTSSSYLQHGLLSGEAFVSALYQNIGGLSEKRGVVLSNDEIKQDVFNYRCNLYLGSKGYQIDFLDIQKPLSDLSIDLYFYGIPHAPYVSPKENFLYFNQVFSSVFMIVIDGWGCDVVRRDVFEAFDELKYKILFEDEIPASDVLGNGQYVAVIKK